MSEQTPEGAGLTPEQQAFLTAQTAQQAASEGAGIQQAQQDVASQLTERGPLLPAESQIDALMAQIKAQSEQLAQMQAAMGSVQRQMEEAQAASGGPLTVRYAQGAADKLAALQDAHPNNPQGVHHFDPAQEAAGKLVEASKQVVKGGGPVQAVKDAAADVERFLARTHARIGGGHLDWSAIADDLELAVAEAVKLAA